MIGRCLVSQLLTGGWWIVAIGDDDLHKKISWNVTIGPKMKFGESLRHHLCVAFEPSRLYGSEFVCVNHFQSSSVIKIEYLCVAIHFDEYMTIVKS